MSFCQFQHQGFDLHIYDRVEHVPSKWDSLLPEGHHLKLSLLNATEKAGLEGFSFAYILVFREHTPIGVAYMQLFQINKSSLHPDLLKSDKAGVLGQFVLNKGMNLAICGHLFRNQWQGYYFEDEIDYQLIFKVLNAFVSSKACHETPDVVLLKECDNTIQPNLLEANRFQEFSQDLIYTMSLNKEWENFEDYTQNLSSKYQKRALKVRQQGIDLKRHWLDDSALADYLPEMMNFYLNLVNRQTVRPANLNANYFLMQKQALGDNFRILGYFHNDQLVGFASYLFFGNQAMELHYIGFSEPDNKTYSLYFNMLFDALEYAITEGYQMLHLGRTGHDVKISLGAHPTVANNYFKVKRGVKGLLLKSMLEQLAQALSHSGPERSPFKSELETTTI